MKNTLKLISFLLRISSQNQHSRFWMCIVVFAGIIGGLGNAALVAMINTAIHSSVEVTTQRIYFFVGLCLAVAIGRFISQYSLANIASRAVFDLRTRLCAQILATPLKVIEEIGTPRLLAHLTDDIGALSEALVQIPVLLINLAIIAGSFFYLGWLSWKLLLFIAGVMAVGVLCYQGPMARSTGYFRQARENWNELFSGFQGLTHGLKELKLHRERRARFYETKLVFFADRIRAMFLRGYVILAAASSWGQVLFFVTLGILLFGVRKFTSLDASVASGYALVLLFIISPIEVILNMLSVMSRARIASQQLESLGEILPRPTLSGLETGPEWTHWQEIRLDGIMHQFHNDGGGEGFMLGPIDLKLTPGEIVFIVGGNGSGKTTLAKLLVGPYLPQMGSIIVDGTVVNEKDIETYRQQFSAVFSDFYLFDICLG